MTASTELLVDAFGRIPGIAQRVVRGLTPDELATQVEEGTNSIGWLIWHLTRIQDAQVAEVAGSEQVWTAAGWFDRFGLPFSAAATGYGQSQSEMAQVAGISGELLIGYYNETHERSVQFVSGLGDSDLARVVDRSWDPPVTLGVRLISVIADDLQHAGQAAFVAGILSRRR